MRPCTAIQSTTLWIRSCRADHAYQNNRLIGEESFKLIDQSVVPDLNVVVKQDQPSRSRWEASSKIALYPSHIECTPYLAMMTAVGPARRRMLGATTVVKRSGEATQTPNTSPMCAPRSSYSTDGIARNIARRSCDVGGRPQWHPRQRRSSLLGRVVTPRRAKRVACSGCAVTTFRLASATSTLAISNA